MKNIYHRGLVRHSRNQIGKQEFTTEDAEFAEIFYFKLSFSESAASPWCDVQIPAGFS